MDPSIMKFLEEDEDESMHSGADVEAMSAALNRDIGGDPAAIALLSDTDAGALVQGSNFASKEALEKWETSCEDVQTNNRPEYGQPSLQQKASHSDKLHQQSETKPLQFIEKEEIKKSEQIAIQDFNKFEGLKQEFSQHPESHHQQQHIAQQSNSQQITSANLANMISQKSENQQQHIVQQSNNQQISTSNQPNVTVTRMKAATSIPFHMLIPILQAHLDKDRSMQLQSTFGKLRNNEVNKEDFLRVVKNIVGDQMLRQAVQKVQIQLQAQASRNVQTNTNPFSLQAQASSQQLPSSGVQQITGAQSFQAAVHSPGTGHAATKASNQKSREVESRLDGKGAHSAQSYTKANATNQERDTSVVPVQKINNKQHHVLLQQSSFSKSGSTSIYNTHAYPRPPISSSTALRPQNLDANTRQTSASQGTISTQMRPTQPMNVMNLPKYEQNSATETKRQPTIPATSSSTSQNNAVMWQLSTNKEQKDSAFQSMTYIKQEIIDQSSEPPNKSHIAPSESTSFSSAQVNQQNSALGSSSTVGKTQDSGSLPSQVEQAAQMQSQNSSATPSLAGAATKAPLKKQSVGQKKPFEALGSSPPMSSKKQKTSGISLDQSIEQLNDVTAVSGVNLREEEEQLFSGLKDESRASEATRRIVQEEEERLLLLKAPLQKKLSDIMSKCGLKEISEDVERCLTLCVEERLKGLISYLIRLSKQRVDSEKTRHEFAITSDVRYQILIMNEKAKEEWDKKKAEEFEKLRKTDGSTGVDADKEDGRSKTVKVNKEEDDKMRTNAANVAARAAVGGDDMLSKWQLMAEQARQKREGGDGSSSSQLGKAASSKPSLSSGRGSREKRESEKKGGGRRFGRKNTQDSHPRVARNISVKDVIAALEREPQMSRSSLVYRLHEKLSNNSSAE